MLDSPLESPNEGKGRAPRESIWAENMDSDVPGELALDCLPQAAIVPEVASAGPAWVHK